VTFGSAIAARTAASALAAGVMLEAGQMLALARRMP
jgi:hypothetical protein